MAYVRKDLIGMFQGEPLGLEDAAKYLLCTLPPLDTVCDAVPVGGLLLTSVSIREDQYFGAGNPFEGKIDIPVKGQKILVNPKGKPAGWAYLVALGVYAYDEGGAAAVGLVGLIRMIPAALAAPFTASLADRFPRVTVMVASDTVRFVLMLGAAAVIAGDGPAAAVYVLVAASTVTGTVFRPAQAALLPSLVRAFCVTAPAAWQPPAAYRR